MIISVTSPNAFLLPIASSFRQLNDPEWEAPGVLIFSGWFQRAEGVSRPPLFRRFVPEVRRFMAEHCLTGSGPTSGNTADLDPVIWGTNRSSICLVKDQSVLRGPRVRFRDLSSDPQVW